MAILKLDSTGSMESVEMGEGGILNIFYMNFIKMMRYIIYRVVIDFNRGMTYLNKYYYGKSVFSVLYLHCVCVFFFFEKHCQRLLAFRCWRTFLRSFACLLMSRIYFFRRRLQSILYHLFSGPFFV